MLTQVVVLGVIFSGANKDGDFNWMARQPQYADTLFIFNDNAEQFLQHLAAPTDRNGPGCTPGGGNAVIRPLQCQTPPRALGIPTGAYGMGFDTLDNTAKELIDQAIANIEQVVRQYGYKRIIYSAQDASGMLGTGIFRVGTDVKQYITDRLKALERTL